MWAKPRSSCDMSARGRGPGTVGGTRAQGTAVTAPATAWVGARAGAGSTLAHGGAPTGCTAWVGSQSVNLAGLLWAERVSPEGLLGSRRGCLARLGEVGLGLRAGANPRDGRPRALGHLKVCVAGGNFWGPKSRAGGAGVVQHRALSCRSRGRSRCSLVLRGF